MTLTLLSPSHKQTYQIAWLEVNTPVGNFVIQPGHAPMIVQLSANAPLTICLKNGKQISYTTAGGVLEVHRKFATILLNAQTAREI